MKTLHFTYKKYIHIKQKTLLGGDILNVIQIHCPEGDICGSKSLSIIQCRTNLMGISLIRNHCS